MRKLIPLIVLTVLAMCSCTGRNISDKLPSYPGDAVVDDSVRIGKPYASLRIIDSLQSESKDKDEYYHYETRRAAVSYYMAQPESIELHSRRAIEYLQTHASTPLQFKDLSTALQTRSIYFQNFVGDVDSILSYQERGLEAAHRSGITPFYVTVMANTGDTYRQNGMLDKAADTYRHAMILADSLGLTDDQYVPIYSGLASVYTEMHNFKQSAIWWDKMAELWPYMMETEKFYYLNNRGHDYYLKKDYNSSLREFEKLRDFLDTHPDMEWERHFCNANMSDVLIKLGRGDEAADMIEDNLDYYSRILINPHIMAHVLLQKMSLLHSAGKDNEVERMLERYPEISSCNIHAEMDKLEFLKDYYADKGNWKEAYPASERYHEIKDSLLSERVHLSTSEQELRYHRDHQLLGMKVELNNQRRNTLIITYTSAILILIIILIILVLQVRNSRRERRMMHRIMNLRLESIRTRITPHFIYNALNQEILAREEGRPGNLDNLVRLLHTQQILSEQALSTLTEEISFAEDYIRVQEENLRSGLIFEKIIGESVDSDTVKLPSMTLQILVENAFKHGFPTLPPETPAYLRISATRTDSSIVVSVFNNMDGDLKGIPVKKSARIGIRLITTSIELMNLKRSHKIMFNVDPNAECDGCKGFIASLSIPTNL